MSDTTYQIFQDGQTYKVRITVSAIRPRGRRLLLPPGCCVLGCAGSTHCGHTGAKGANDFGPTAGGLKDRALTGYAESCCL
jgi:hypothetical protein